MKTRTIARGVAKPTHPIKSTHRKRARKVRFKATMRIGATRLDGNARVSIETTPFKLPTLAAFKALPLRRRTEVFLSWVRTQRGSYTSTLPHECALWQLGEALGLSGHYANCWSIFKKESPFNDGDMQVLSDTASIKALPVIHAPEIGSFSTFSSLAKRLERHLAT